MYRSFDVIVHGVNCMCVQKKGIAKQMAAIFGTNDPVRYPMEDPIFRGDINKLGTIESFLNVEFNVIVVNAYTQYRYGTNEDGSPALDYSALLLCLKKINHIFKGKHVGMPKIGAGLGGGHWDTISRMIKKYLTNCDVTIIEYEDKGY